MYCDCSGDRNAMYYISIYCQATSMIIHIHNTVNTVTKPMLDMNEVSPQPECTLVINSDTLKFIFSSLLTNIIYHFLPIFDTRIRKTQKS